MRTRRASSDSRILRMKFAPTLPVAPVTRMYMRRRIVLFPSTPRLYQTKGKLKAAWPPKPHVRSFVSGSEKNQADAKPGPVSSNHREGKARSSTEWDGCRRKSCRPDGRSRLCRSFPLRGRNLADRQRHSKPLCAKYVSGKRADGVFRLPSSN